MCPNIAWQAIGLRCTPASDCVVKSFLPRKGEQARPTLPWETKANITQAGFYKPSKKQVLYAYRIFKTCEDQTEFSVIKQ